MQNGKKWRFWDANWRRTARTGKIAQLINLEANYFAVHAAACFAVQMLAVEIWGKSKHHVTL